MSTAFALYSYYVKLYISKGTCPCPGISCLLTRSSLKKGWASASIAVGRSLGSYYSKCFIKSSATWGVPAGKFEEKASGTKSGKLRFL